MKNRQQGFTLIELLVVIAIIGILAALVLVSLGNARQKAQDARIKSDVAQLRTLAEIHFDAAGNYTNLGGGATTCFGGTASACRGGIENSVASLTGDITAAGGTLSSNSGATAFCVAATLASDAADKVCVDSTGETITSTNATPCATTACAP